jgi:uncharacterized protein YeaO (DUF488 family)
MAPAEVLPQAPSPQDGARGIVARLPPRGLSPCHAASALCREWRFDRLLPHAVPSARN